MAKMDKDFVIRMLSECDKRISDLRGQLVLEDEENCTKAVAKINIITTKLNSVMGELILGSSDQKTLKATKKLEEKVQRCIIVDKLIRAGLSIAIIVERTGMVNSRVIQVQKEIPSVADHPMFLSYLKDEEMKNVTY